ncbi:MAG: SIMPL domain-containing protein [Patescibacteria group bacterium]
MNTEEFQKVLRWGRIAIIVLTVFLLAQALGALKELKGVDPAYNSISVTGEGEVVSIPDVATFSFSVSADAKVVSDAQAEVTEKMDAILAGLEALGVEDKDIKTTDYSIWPKYTYQSTICSPTYCPPGRQVEDGYTVSHSILVKIRKTEDAGKALALAGDKGATNLSGITFAIDDPDKLLDEARALAIEDARAKAKVLSKELGVRLVRVVSFYDNTDRGIPYYAEGMGGDMMLKASSAPAPTIPAGENKSIVSVTVVYEIR